MKVKDIIIKNHYRFINYHHFHHKGFVNLKTVQIWNFEVNKMFPANFDISIVYSPSS